MRTNILLDSLGNNVNPEQSLINYSNVNGSAAFSLFTNQITLEFYNNIILSSGGLYEPDMANPILSGLSGNIVVSVWPSINAPYMVPITPNPNIDIANSCILQWFGLTNKINLVCNSIIGAQYINVLLDRNQ